MITEEQSQQIKEQLLKQLDKFPEDNQEQIKEQILSMSTSEIEEFVKQNQLNHLEPEDPCIFCSIAKGKIPSYKIDEDDSNIAILEINPLSKGHSLIVPKQHHEKPLKSSIELAKKVANKIQQRLNPKKVEISETKIANHGILELIPSYDNIPSGKKHASEEELKNLQEELTKKVPEKIENKTAEKIEKPKPLPKLKPRIP